LASFKFSNDLRKDVFKKIMELSYNQTDDFNTGSLVTRVTNDITQVQNMISQALRGFIRALSFFVLGIFFTLKISGNFGIILAIILPLEVGVLALFMKKVFPVFSVIQKKLDKVNTVVHENVSGARVVKAFGKEDYEYDRFVSTNNDYTESNLYVGKTAAFLMPALMLIIYVAQFTIYMIGGNSIIDAFRGAILLDEMITVGQISQAVTYINMICMSIMMLGMTFTNMARAVASAKRINEVLDCDLEISGGNYNASSEALKGTIEFKNVAFKYPKSNGNVLSNINLKIEQGQTVAIVGSTGCGKSSLVNLIPRFYDVTEGEILLNGVNVKEYNLYELRNKIGMCLQKAELFKGTIKENVKWGKEDASDEEVYEACDIAQAKEFIESKELTYDELVEAKGTSLSGGQKQRLSIARAIIKKPEILIFDDSTSALDLVTESKLHEAMKDKIPNTTKIIVAQRIATAKNADFIAVIDNGTIVDFDTHANLLANSAIYQDIYYSQLKEDKIYE
jgi:ATP-binding cassette subfamily B protein